MSEKEKFCSAHAELITDIKWIKRISIAIFTLVAAPFVVAIGLMVSQKVMGGN